MDRWWHRGSVCSTPGPTPGPPGRSVGRVTTARRGRRMLLEGKKLLVTGVLTDSSIAFHVARLAQEQGAEIVLTSFGRTMKITQVIARRLPAPAPVLELDVTDADHLASLAERVGEHTDRLDGVVHSIGFAPAGAFNFLEAGWDDVATALHTSAYSLKALAVATQPLLQRGSS